VKDRAEAGKAVKTLRAVLRKAAKDMSVEETSVRRAEYELTNLEGELNEILLPHPEKPEASLRILDGEDG
jgi:hypothetical protein